MKKLNLLLLYLSCVTIANSQLFSVGLFDLKKHSSAILEWLTKENEQNNNNTCSAKVFLISSLLLPTTNDNQFFKDTYVSSQQNVPAILKSISNIVHERGIELHPIPFPTELCTFIDTSVNKYKKDESYAKEYKEKYLAEAQYFFEIYMLYKKANYQIIGILLPDTAPCKKCKRIKAQCICKIKNSFSSQLLKKQINADIYKETKNAQKLLSIFIFSPDEFEFMLCYLTNLSMQNSNIG